MIAAVLGLSARLPADTDRYTAEVSFNSDTQSTVIVDIPKLNNHGGLLSMNSVTVEIYHSGSADIRGDNDDPCKTAVVQSRIVRIWQVLAPNLFHQEQETHTSAPVGLMIDDGDGLMFDDTAPDGTDFGGPVGYVDDWAGTFSPKIAYYQADGNETVDFSFSPQQMTNDTQFFGEAPDLWQMQIANPIVTIEMEVIYDYDVLAIPGDATLDGPVDLEDLTVLGSHYGTEGGARWTDGDFNDDGTVGLTDLTILGSHYGESPPASVPAPAPLGALLAGFLLLRRRK